MEDIVAIVMLFGGGTLFLLSWSPVGKAYAERMRARTHAQHGAPDGELAAQVEELRHEVDALRGELAEAHERLDFAERLLARPTTTDAAPPAAG